MKEGKDSLRHRMRAFRGALTADAILEAGEAVAERLVGLPELATPQTVLVTLSTRRELPTGPSIAALVAAGHRLVVPFIDGDRMVAKAYDGTTVPGAYGIPTSAGPVVSDVHVVLCPGLAFDVAGGRLGYGRAYFDRFLLEVPEAVPIALTYDGAIVDSVPVEAHDVRMRLLVSEARTVRVEG